MVDQTLESSRSLSIQARAREDSGTEGMPVILWIATQGSIIPAWWSEARDVRLREFWKKNDHLSGAIFNFISKMTAIPKRVIPRDYSNKTHVREAGRYTELLDAAEFGEGWINFYSKWIEDVIGTDNGGFFEIIGPGDPTGPLTGGAVTISHLDSALCRRTGNPEYPVIYTDTDGKSYKLHYTRVAYYSQMPSPIVYMNGIGFCSVSRCINVAQNLLDVVTYKQEKLGSRPHRALLITQGGLDPEEIRQAFALADSRMDSQNLSRYSKIVIVGSQSNPDSDAKLVEFSSLPDGFDEETSVVLGMATIAMALGVDARELFPAMSAGATRADALLAHIKQRGKGPGQIISAITGLINRKFLPAYLKLEFDYQDDAEDHQIAEIRHIRSQARERNVNSQSMQPREIREQMLDDGEISREQFDRMELEDGRLEDGTPVLSLFFSEDPEIKRLLTFDNAIITDPFDFTGNDSQFALDMILTQQAKALESLAKAKSQKDITTAMKALAALKQLRLLYEEQGKQLQNDMQLQNQDQNGNPNGNGSPGGRLRSFPTRRQNLLRPNQPTELSSGDDLRPGKDDKIG